MPLLIWGAVAGIGKLFGPTAAKWAVRFVDFAQLFTLMLSQPNYIEDLPTLNQGSSNGPRGTLRDRMKSMCSGKHSFSEAVAHHLIPYELKDHVVVRYLNVDINHPSNGIFLHNEHHVGNHPDYRFAMAAELDRIAQLPQSQWKAEVIRARNTAGYALYNGAPLLRQHGSSPTVWTKVLRK